jgi:FixJ family two-component response regulator
MNHKTDTRVYIIDDDPSVCRSLSFLLISAGYTVETFNNIQDFIETDYDVTQGCIILDVFLSEESGIQQYDKIRKRFPNLPVIYISGMGDIPISVQAMRKGAINFLQKPVNDDTLLASVEEAISNSIVIADTNRIKDEARKKIASLSPRELEIFRFVIRGFLNKQIAAELNIAEHTVKLHRGRITWKLGVKSVPEMVNLAHLLELA